MTSTTSTTPEVSVLGFMTDLDTRETEYRISTDETVSVFPASEGWYVMSTDAGPAVRIADMFGPYPSTASGRATADRVARNLVFNILSERSEHMRLFGF